MKSGKNLFLISVTAGIASWILDAFFERFVFFRSGRTFFDHLIHIPADEFYNRVITFLVFVVFGIIVSGLFEKRHAAEEKLRILRIDPQWNSVARCYRITSVIPLKRPSTRRPLSLRRPSPF